MKKTLGVLTVMLCATSMIYAQADGIATHKSSDVVMASDGAAMGKVIASGSCGKNVNYELYDDYTLRIFGSGPMTNFDHIIGAWGTDAPWEDESQWIKAIKSVVIEDGVTRIGAHAFLGCTSLTEVIISNSVTSIGHEAFRDCKALTKIDIPCSVTCIGTFAFDGCSSLAEINLPNGIETIESGVFYGCSSLEHITIPNSVTSIEHNAFHNCTLLTEIIIPDSVTYIGMDAFIGCHNLEYVKIGKGVTTIGECAFWSNNSDKELVVEITAETRITVLGTTINSFGEPEHITIRVPGTTLADYRSAGDWSYYMNRFVGYVPTITGISSVRNGQPVMKSDAVYDLQGKKVSEMCPHGIYIVNGKKIMR